MSHSKSATLYPEERARVELFVMATVKCLLYN